MTCREKLSLTHITFVIWYNRLFHILGLYNEKTGHLITLSFIFLISKNNPSFVYCTLINIRKSHCLTYTILSGFNHLPNLRSEFVKFQDRLRTTSFFVRPSVENLWFLFEKLSGHDCSAVARPEQQIRDSLVKGFREPAHLVYYFLPIFQFYH